ncbi:MAG: hypothetical protein P1U39_00840 [Legionellaceae bacterium]|nr:hypothetical protein [Legionellaceae bacterium]
MHQEVTDEHPHNIHDEFNALTQEFLHHEPFIMEWIQAAWRAFEEYLQIWVSQSNKVHDSAPVENALVELEETQNARKLDKLKNIKIETRFLCGITHEIMTHPMYDKHHPHQKMDCRPLLAWLSESKTHPFNRSELHVHDLEYDEELKAEIDQFVTATLENSASPYISSYKPGAVTSA